MLQYIASLCVKYKLHEMELECINIQCINRINGLTGAMFEYLVKQWTTPIQNYIHKLHG